jgi:hypothetical protein
MSTGPSVSLSAGGTLALVGVAVVGFVLWRGLPKVAAAASAAAEAVNPLNPDNVFATGVNAVGGAIVTDPVGPGKAADGSWSLGGWIFDVTHPATAQAVRDVGQPVNTGGATGSW